MPIRLPNLDDRHWADLVDEGRTLIPFYAAEWTDQNYSDPGITLMEQLASITEMDIFQLNRITNRARLKFLKLVGIYPESPKPAFTALQFTIAKSGAAVALPAGLIFTGNDALGVATPFRTLAPVQIVPAQLAAVQVKDAIGFRDMTERWRRGISFGVFGDMPTPGGELYLGFDPALTAGQQLSLYFSFGGGRSGAEERHRILAEAAAAKQGCIPVIPACAGVAPTIPAPFPKSPTVLPPFAGVRTSWEALTATGWSPLSGNAAADDTRGFTLDGAVVLTLPQDTAPQKLGRVDAPLSYLRVRFAAGAYDAPPVALSILGNAVRAEQSAPVATLTWNLAAGLVASPPAPASNPTGLDLQFDGAGNITALNFVTDGSPRLRILAFTAAGAAAAGSLTVEAASLGIGDGSPGQQFQLPQSPIEACSLDLFSYEDGGLVIWRRRQDFDASKRGDRDFLLDAEAGTLTFGDGDKGMVAPAGAPFFASFLATRAEAGNLSAGAVNALVDSPHNRALIEKFDDVKSKIAVTQPLSAAGGAAAETLGHAIGRTITMLAEPQRAVTLEDYETLAQQTPGAVVARAKAWANRHPSFPCFEAPGMITLVILPDMPGPHPTPSQALRNSVAAYLNRRRILGSRLAVVGPTYREVAVEAQVKALPGASKTGVQQRIVDALNEFFDPLTGGPEGTGWPFGRDVYQAEVMQVIEKVQGVNFIVSMDLLADGCSCAPQCGNVCLAPGWLVAAGQHQIEVL